MNEISPAPVHSPDAPAEAGFLLQAVNLHKHYHLAGHDLHILRGVNLGVCAGQWLAILGRSGSGKSTLMHLLGGLDRPDQGTVHFNLPGSPRDIFKLKGRSLDHYRSRHVGFVFQQYHLLPELTALENVLMARMIRHGVLGYLLQRRDARQRAQMLLEQVGLADRMRHRPSRLSGGERQRVAIARALMNEPDILLADEPTGNLDTDTGLSLMQVFEDLRAAGQTIVMVTHDVRIAQMADQSLVLDHGRL